MMKKRIWIGVGVLVVLAVVAYLGVSYVVYDTLSRITPGGGDSAGNTPAQFRVPWPPWDKTFDTSPYQIPVYHEVSFPSRQAGLNLAAWYVPGDAGAPVILMTHGITGGKGDGNLLPVAGMLHNHGFNVLLYDLREHGQSDVEDGRTAIGNEEYLDLLGAWDWLQTEKKYPPERIGLFGASMGAGTTLIAFGQEPRLAAAFVDSPYADLPQIMSEELARNNYPTFLVPGGILMARLVAGDNLIAFSPQDAIRNDQGRPIYIVHGTGDQRVNVRHTYQLAALAAQTGANVTTWIPEDVAHVEAEFIFPEEYERRLVAFFADALGK